MNSRMHFPDEPRIRPGWFVYRGQEQIDIANDLRSVSDL